MAPVAFPSVTPEVEAEENVPFLESVPVRPERPPLHEPAEEVPVPTGEPSSGSRRAALPTVPWHSNSFHLFKC